MTRGNDQDSVGARIKAARRAAKLSQSQLARELGVSRTTVSNWETDLHPPDDPAPVQKFLGLDKDFRMPGDQEPGDDLSKLTNSQLMRRLNSSMASAMAAVAEVAHRLAVDPEAPELPQRPFGAGPDWKPDGLERFIRYQDKAPKRSADDQPVEGLRRYGR
jgi:transcriptional regulator with XRE-family HTH domain